jgi:hypothetical protein
VTPSVAFRRGAERIPDVSGMRRGRREKPEKGQNGRFADECDHFQGRAGMFLVWSGDFVTSNFGPRNSAFPGFPCSDLPVPLLAASPGGCFATHEDSGWRKEDGKARRRRDSRARTRNLAGNVRVFDHRLPRVSCDQKPPKATPKPPDSQGIGTLKPPQCDPKAPYMRPQSHPHATFKPPYLGTARQDSRVLSSCRRTKQPAARFVRACWTTVRPRVFEKRGR